MSAGYSGTPLPKKLGIKPGHRVALVDAPEGFEGTLGALPDDATLHRGLRGSRDFDVIVLFSKEKSTLPKRFARAVSRLDEDGGLWVAWPKRASGVETSLGDGIVRSTGLATGLVDNKVCAIDEIWSGLRFVVRVVDRRKKA